MAVKYTGGKTVTVTVGNLASDTIACAYWYTGAVSPKGYSYVIKGLLDDGNNSTSTDFSYNTVLKGDNQSNSTATTTFKTVDNIYDSSNGRYPTYVWAYVNLLPHFHYPSEYGSIIKTSYIEVRQRQNSISSSTTSFSVYWNEGGVSSKTISPTITCLPSNSYTKTINVKHSNTSITESNSTVTSGNVLNIKVKGKGSSTITLSPSDGAGGTSTTISVTGKTAVTNMSLSGTTDVNAGGNTSLIVTGTPSDANYTKFNIVKSSGTGTAPTSGTFGTAISLTGLSGNPEFLITSFDGCAQKTFKITSFTPSVSITASTPINGETFTYSLSNYAGSGTWTFTYCKHYSTGTAQVTANTGTATVKWTPSDGGTAASKSTTLGVTTTSIAINGNTSSSVDYINNGGSKQLTINLYGPSNATPKNKTFTIAALSGDSLLSSTSGTTGATITVSNLLSASSVITVTSGDKKVSNIVTIVETNPEITLSNTSNNWKGKTFTYTLSSYVGSGTWTLTNCKYYSTGNATITGTSGSATVKWTPNDGGTAVSESLTLKTYTTPSTSISFTDGETAYYDNNNYNNIYWRSFVTNVTNAGGRTVNLSIVNGVIGTTASGSATSVTVSAGSIVWARRSNSSDATVTANVSALTVNNSTTYTFYNTASATKTIT